MVILKLVSIFFRPLESPAKTYHQAGTMSLLNFLDRNSPLLRPRLIELGLQQSQNGNDDQSVGELTSPPSLQLDEGSEIHEQEQSPTTSSSVGDNSGRDHRISEDQTISATTTPLISPGNNDDISGNESMTSTSNNIQFSDKESQILEEQVNPTAVTSISPMLLDANDEEAYPSPNVDGNPGSPWSLFGDGEEQESEGPPNSRSQSPLTDVDPEDILHRSTQEKTHVLISVESASQEQENPSAEQHGASKEKNNSSIEQKTQQDYDAEMAAELQRTNRYSLRSRTPSTSITNSLDWTKSSQSSTTKQQTSSARGKSVPQIKKPRKKGFGKRVTKR